MRGVLAVVVAIMVVGSAAWMLTRREAGRSVVPSDPVDPPGSARSAVRPPAASTEGGEEARESSTVDRNRARSTSGDEPSSRSRADRGRVKRARGPHTDRSARSSTARNPQSTENPTSASDTTSVPGVRATPGGIVVQLRIVGGDERGDLVDVTVLRVPRSDRNRIHPGDWSADVVVARGVESPVALPAAHGAYVYWAWAPGFCWGRVVVEHADGGERRLALEPSAASLSVRLPSLHPSSSAMLRIHRDRPRGPGVELAAERETWLTGLPPASYFARVEIGPAAGNAIQLGAAEFTLSADAERVIEIELDEPPELEGTVPLFGSLNVQGDWSLDGVALNVRPLDVPTIQGRTTLSIFVSEMEAHSVLEWDAGRVTPGRYRLTVEPWGLCRTVTIGDGAAPPVRLTIPPPGEVRATVVERETGAVVDLPQLHWLYRGSVDLRSCRQISESSEGGGAFTFAVPTGQLELSQLFDDTWRIDRTFLTVESGVNVITLEAERASSVVLRLFDGDVPLPTADMPPGIFFRPAAGTGHHVVSQAGGQGGVGRVFRFSGPGTFEVSIPTILGFEPIPSPTITVGVGEQVALDLDLVPAR